MKGVTILSAYIYARSNYYMAVVAENEQQKRKSQRQCRKFMARLVDMLNERDRLTHPEWY